MVKKVKEKINSTKRKIIDTKDKINSVDFDAHWYRRIFHTFAASFLVYYILPDIYWLNVLKFWFLPLIVIIVFLVEILRLKGFISNRHIFGLRLYEKNRVGSYAFFAAAIMILLLFFPQQIAVPCILCACFADPTIGEIRNKFNNKRTILIGFLICMFFFMITWYKADPALMILVGIVGATGAIIGETKKIYWIDDDFMIQMIPALLLLAIWYASPFFGLSMPDPIIYPISSI
jgi:dolichol kinase